MAFVLFTGFACIVFSRLVQGKNIYGVFGYILYIFLTQNLLLNFMVLSLRRRTVNKKVLQHLEFSCTLHSYDYVDQSSNIFSYWFRQIILRILQLILIQIMILVFVFSETLNLFCASVVLWCLYFFSRSQFVQDSVSMCLSFVVSYCIQYWDNW